MSESSKLFASTADKLGSAGASVLGVFCPTCIPAIGAFLSAIGLGFLVNAKVLSGAMVILIFLAVAGFTFSYFREHKNPWPLALAIVGASGIYGGRYLFLSVPVIYGGAAFFIGASAFNWYLRKKAPRLKPCCAVKSAANEGNL